MSRTIHFPLNTLALKRGGLVKDVRDRASALAGAGHAVTLEVLAGQTRLAAVAAEMKANGQLHPDVVVRDVLLALAPQAEHVAGVSWQPEPDEHVYSESGGRVLRTFVDGVFRRYVRLSDAASGDIEVIEHFGPDRRRYLREEFDVHGRVVKRLDYAADLKNATCRRFFDASGECYLTVWADPVSGRWSRPFLHSEGRAFASMKELYAHAFSTLLATEEAPVLTSEFRDHLPNFSGGTFDDAFFGVEHPNLRKVAVVHSNQHRAPYTRGAPLSAGWDRLFEHGSDVDAIVAWTQRQADDINAESPNMPVVSVRPPFAPPALSRPAEVVGQRIVVVARLEPLKKVDVAVRVMARVLERHPSATMQVFGLGRGDETERDIHALVKELGVGHAVSFPAFANGLGEIYDGASLSLFTSVKEGLSLALLESMSRGVPVVSVDAAYGPSDVVDDGVNGYVLPVGDVEGLAESMCRLLDDAALRSELAEGALRTAAGYTFGPYLEFWERVLDGAIERAGAGLAPSEHISSSPRRVLPAVAGWADGGERSLMCVDAQERRTLVLRARGDGTEISRAHPERGRWAVYAGDAASGTIVDLYLEGHDGVERRIDATGDLPQSRGGWALYATAHGVLSLKRSS